MSRSPLYKMRGNGGLHTRFIDDRNLDESCPVQKIMGKGTARTYEGKLRVLIKAGLKAKFIRQSEQRAAGFVTWPYELAEKATGEILKRCEMDERTAAIRNRSIFDLGLYWRRASY